MSNAREIITITSGNFANFVGSHWWNIQETSFCYEFDCSAPLDLDHDVLFQEGLNHRNQVTFTPRLLLLDLESNVCGLRKESALYRTPQHGRRDAAWDGAVDVVQQAPEDMNPYLEDGDPNQRAGSNEMEEEEACFYNRPVAAQPVVSDSNPSAWSLFLKTHLHPRSMVLHKEFLPPNEDDPLGLFSFGKSIYSDIREQAEDALRRMAENCDYLQGFQLLCEGSGAFACAGIQLLQHLTDEYKGKDSICYPLFQQPEEESADLCARQFSSLYSVSGWKNFSSLFAPLSLREALLTSPTPHRASPHLQYQATDAYESSAILATSLEVLTSPYRLRTNRHKLTDLASALTPHGRKMVSSCVSLYPESYVDGESPFMPLTPDHDVSKEAIIQMAALRGTQGLTKASIVPEAFFSSFLQKHLPSSMTTSSLSAEPIRIAPPYPPILRDPAEKINAAGVLRNDDCSSFLSAALHEADGRRLERYASRRESAFSRDEFLEVVEEVHALRDAYDAAYYL